ncbi:hypothetical protein EU245_14280 [Lentibacillus lipolyticus]|nr:hypothetical protein EU245_14280 [Lentibacillus lipolyticus]
MFGSNGEPVDGTNIGFNYETDGDRTITSISDFAITLSENGQLSNVQSKLGAYNIQQISLANDISESTTVIFGQLVDFDFDEYTLDISGNALEVNTDEEGTMTLDGSADTSIDGDLTVDAENATVNNNVNVSEDVTVTDVANGTWNENGNGNTLTVNDASATVNITNAVSSLTVGAQDVTVTGVDNVESATVQSGATGVTFDAQPDSLTAEEDVDVEGDEAPEAVTNAAFTDTDENAEEIAGNVTFTSSNSNDVDHYLVKVGDGEATTVQAGSGELEYSISQDTNYASDITVIAVDDAGNESEAAKIDVVDSADNLAENFNTNNAEDYTGYSVGWNIGSLALDSLSKMEVSLYDSEGNVLATNTSTDKIFNLDQDKFSTPFVVTAGTYNPDNDSYWTFGEYNDEVPAKAVITLTDKDGTVYEIENTNLTGDALK